MEDQQIRINRETLEETVRGVTPGFPIWRTSAG